MVGRLRQLPAETQHLLRLAACVGNARPAPDAEHPRRPGGDRGRGQGCSSPRFRRDCWLRAGEEQYRFLHDRIQQAAHALLSAEERKAVHLRIGRLQLERLSPEQAREEIFDVVSQLNAGVDLIQEPAERHHVARLNAEAGQKAETAVARGPAIAYFTAAFALIPGDPWQMDYALAFKVRLARARCELLASGSRRRRFSSRRSSAPGRGAVPTPRPPTA